MNRASWARMDVIVFYHEMCSTMTPEEAFYNA